MGNINKICVIIPFYNSEKYLKECLQSVFNQSYHNYDVVLVNDGSTDKSYAICQSFKSKFKNCIIFNENHKGPGNARNVGIEYALKGNYNWITFVDSDDIISSHYLEFLLNSCKKYSTLIGVGGVTRVNALESSYEDGLIPSSWLFSKFKISKKFGTFSMCSKLFNLKLFDKNTRFPIDKRNEDAFLTPKLLFNVKEISFVNCNLYFYRENENSRTFDAFTEKSFDEFSAHIKFIDFAISKKMFEEAQISINRCFSLISRYLFKFKYKWKKNRNRKMYVFRLKKLRHDLFIKYNTVWKLDPKEKMFKIFKFRYHLTYIILYFLLRKRFN